MENSFLSALAMAGAAIVYIAAIVIIFKFAAYLKIAPRPMKEKIAAWIAVIFLGVIVEEIFSGTMTMDRKFAVIFLIVGLTAGAVIGYLGYREKVKNQPMTRQQRRHAGRSNF